MRRLLWALTGHAGCAGVPLRVSFAAPMTAAQQQWLSTTLLPLRCIKFHPMDPALLSILQQVCQKPHVGSPMAAVRNDHT